jgi:hypothetical protein
MTTKEANNRQMACITIIAIMLGITKEQAALIWCQSCAKKWREGIA